jgi:NitT/TauT family transport system substrate-binding protein
MTLLYVLKKNGIDPQNDLTLDDSIDFDLMASAFSTGQADFVTLFEPTASQIEQSGKGYIITSIGEEAGEIPYTAYFAKKSYIEENSDIIQKFTNAIYKGQQYVKNHTSREIAESIQEFFPDTDLDLLENAVTSYRNIGAWNETPFMSEESFNLLQQIIYDAGELEEFAPYTDVVNNFYK